MKRQDISHYPYIDEEVPVGVTHVNQARCTCGWEGTLGASWEEARAEKFGHKREHYVPTADDIDWLTGSGRWSQE